MDMTALLDELTYRVLGEARNGADARRRLAIIAHWADEQDARLAAGKRTLRLDSAEMVAEALAAQQCPEAVGEPATATAA